MHERIRRKLAYIVRREEMNAATNSKPSPVSLGIGVMVFIAVVIGIYYLYKYISDTNKGRKQVSLFTGTLSFADLKKSGTLADKQLIDPVKGISDGGEFTLSSWLYIADVRQNAGSGPVHLFELGQRDHTSTDTSSTNNKKVALLATLSPQTGKLKINLGTTNTSEKLDGAAVVSALANDSGSDKCSIQSIEYQRWVLVTCVVNSRTLDIYIDGKLARSCVYNAPYVIQSGTNQKIYFGLNDGATSNLRGFFSNPTLASYAMSPDEVYRLYMAGPEGGNTILDWIKSYFSVNVTFKAGDQTYSV